MGMEGRCPRCGARYYGWALSSPRNQMCERCGVGLDILDDGGNSFTGYSPFSALEYELRHPDYASSPEEGKEE